MGEGPDLGLCGGCERPWEGARCICGWDTSDVGMGLSEMEMRKRLAAINVSSNELKGYVGRKLQEIYLTAREMRPREYRKLTIRSSEPEALMLEAIRYVGWLRGDADKIREFITRAFELGQAKLEIENWTCSSCGLPASNQYQEVCAQCGAPREPLDDE